jgi:hypothetical protein
MLRSVSIAIMTTDDAGLTHCSGAFRSTRKAYTHGVRPHFLCSSLGHSRNVLRRSSKLLGRICVQVLHRAGRYVILLLPSPLALLTDHQRLASPHSSRSSCQDSTQERSWAPVLLFGWQWLHWGKSHPVPPRVSFPDISQWFRQRHRRLRCLLHPRQTRIVAHSLHDRRRCYGSDSNHRDHRSPR